MAKLQETAVHAYQALQLRDYGRIDFRLDKKGRPHVLEVNPNPDIAPENRAAKRRAQKMLNDIDEVF